MTNTLVNKETWFKAMEESLNDVSTGMLGFEEGQILSVSENLPEKMTGAHVAMISLHDSINMGIISSQEGCNRLAKAFVGVEPGEELDESDIQDALGEIVNIVAGGVKTRMIDVDPTIEIGLPVFFKGTISPRSRVASYVLDVKIGPIESKLFIIIDTK